MQEDLLREKFNLLEFMQLPNNWLVKVEPSVLHDILVFLKNTSEFDCNMLYTIVGSDFNEFYRLDYVLCSTKLNEQIIIRVELSKNSPHIGSVIDIYPSADWDEREIYDLLGVVFLGRASLERLFMPKGWIGHPLRKDYVQDDKRLEWNNG